MFLLILKKLRKHEDINRKTYENILLRGDYNVDVKETNAKVSCSQHKLTGIVKSSE